MRMEYDIVSVVELDVVGRIINEGIVYLGG